MFEYEIYEVVSETEGIIEVFNTRSEAESSAEDIRREQYDEICFSPFDCPSIFVRKKVL